MVYISETNSRTFKLIYEYMPPIFGTHKNVGDFWMHGNIMQYAKGLFRKKKCLKRKYFSSFWKYTNIGLFMLYFLP